MTRRYALFALAATVLFVGGWALAQQTPIVPAKLGTDTPGRFAVTATASGAVLVDTATGQTWVLRQAVDAPNGLGLPPAWEPAHRLETKEAAEKWKELERKRRQDPAKAQAK